MGSTATFASGINRAGVISGEFKDSSGTSHGFVRNAKGKITAFDPAGSSSTYAASINKSGSIAGAYDADNGQRTHGYVRIPQD
jgi:hypothetical protein